MAKADLHIHSKYSNRPNEWFLQRLGAAQSYTEPEAIYEHAKRAGMNFVTITDHNTIEGSLQLAQKYPDAFTGVQTTTYFPEDHCKIHLLIYGLNGEQFEEVQRVRADIYQLRDYLVDQEIAHSVAHATYDINHRLTISHLEKLALLFDVFEAINASMNDPGNRAWYHWLKYLTSDHLAMLEEKYSIRAQHEDSWIKGFTGGSDDHGNLFVGKAYTMGNAATREAFLEGVYKRKTFAKGRSSDFHTLAFTIYKVAQDFSSNKSKSFARSPFASISSLIFDEGKPSILDSIVAMAMKAENGYKRQVGELIETIRRQNVEDVDSKFDLLYDKIADVVDQMIVEAGTTVASHFREGNFFTLSKEVSAALPGVFLLAPFFSSIRHMNANRKIIDELRNDLPEPPERKILWFTDTLVDMNGPSVTLRNMGWAFYANGIDVRIVTSLLEEEVDSELPPNTINLPRLIDFELPYYSQYTIKIPSVLKAMKMLHSLQPDEIFISTPGPVGVLGLLLAKLLNVRAVGVYHTDFTNELMEITHADDTVIDNVEQGLRWFYSQMDEIKVPTRQYIDILGRRGLDSSKMAVFPRLIDHEIFKRTSPEQLNGSRLTLEPGPVFLYVGRISRDKNLEFLVDVFREMKERRGDVQLVVAGKGPYLEEMKEKLKDVGGVQFLGRVPYEKLPQIYSQAHALVFPSTTDTFGMVVLEAQCCELPAVVSNVGGPMEIVEDGVTGRVLPALKKEVWVESLLDVAETAVNDTDRYQEMRTASRTRATAAYGWNAVLEGLTTQVLKPRPIELRE